MVHEPPLPSFGSRTPTELPPPDRPFSPIRARTDADFSQIVYGREGNGGYEGRSPLQRVERPVRLAAEQELADRLEAAWRREGVLADGVYVAEVLLEALLGANAAGADDRVHEIHRLVGGLVPVAARQRQRDALLDADAIPAHQRVLIGALHRALDVAHAGVDRCLRPGDAVLRHGTVRQSRHRVTWRLCRRQR